MAEKNGFTYEEDLLCVKTFFRLIDFDITLNECMKEALQYVRSNLSSQSERSPRSYECKLKNIEFRFRELAKLDKGGLKNISIQCKEMVNEEFKKSKFVNPKKIFDSKWKEGANKTGTKAKEPKSVNLTETFNSNWKQNQVKNKIKVKEPEFKIADIKNTETIQRLKRDSKIKSDYLINMTECEMCGTNETFINYSNERMYFEVHHFIPYNKETQIKYEFNLDNPINLIGLCPQCHRAIHLAKDRDDKIEQIFNKKSKDNNFVKLLSGNKLSDLLNDYRITFGQEENKTNNIDDEEL